MCFPVGALNVCMFFFLIRGKTFWDVLTKRKAELHFDLVSIVVVEAYFISEIELVFTFFLNIAKSFEKNNKHIQIPVDKTKKNNKEGNNNKKNSMNNRYQLVLNEPFRP